MCENSTTLKYFLALAKDFKKLYNMKTNTILNVNAWNGYDSIIKTQIKKWHFSCLSLSFVLHLDLNRIAIHLNRSKLFIKIIHSHPQLL